MTVLPNGKLFISQLSIYECSEREYLWIICVTCQTPFPSLPKHCQGAEWKNQRNENVKHNILLLLHPFNGLFSRITWVSWHQKGKPFWILLQQEMMGWQWHQLHHYANHLHLTPDR